MIMTENNNIKQRLEDLSDRAINGNKIWRARKLMNFMRTKDWGMFREYVFEGMKLCSAAGFNPRDHFIKTDPIILGGGYDDDYWLSAYGCNLVLASIPNRRFIGELIYYFACESQMNEMKSDFIRLLQYGATLTDTSSCPLPPLKGV